MRWMDSAKAGWVVTSATRSPSRKVARPSRRLATYSFPERMPRPSHTRGNRARASAGTLGTKGGHPMDRKTAGEFDQELLNLFDQYVHGDIDRRGFLERAAKFAVGGMTAAALLEGLNPRFAEAQQVAKDDKRLRTEWIDYESPQGTGKVRAYVARPEAVTAKLPGVLVVHENRGLNPHIEDITRRLALDNFVALAPDALTPLGGYPGDEDKAREAFAKLDQTKTLEDFVAAAGMLKSRPECTGKIGVVGFCYGGAIAN